MLKRFKLEKAAQYMAIGALAEKYFSKPRTRERANHWGLEILESRVLLSSYNVTSLADDGSAGTLRWAIQQVDAVPGGTNTISFQSGLTGTISLTQGAMTISSGTTTITGPGANLLAIDGGGLTNVLTINIGVTVTLNNLTISNGYNSQAGGGINNSGTLNINYSAISSNTSGNNGGGILNNNSGRLTIINSTLANNVAGLSGGGIANGTNTVTIINSTMTGNTCVNSGGAIYNALGAINIFDSTIVANLSNTWGGATAGNIKAMNTIIARNTSPASGENSSTLNPTSSHNLIGDGSGGLTNGVNGNILGSIASPLNPMVNTLQNNGGSTLTMSLKPGSPAINAGSNALAVDTNLDPLSYDERGVGFPRINNGTVDIGAYEASAVQTTLTWNNPSAITYGTALTSNQLNATANYSGTSVPGTFVYTPALGTVLHAGANQTLSVVFTPTDTTSYLSVSGSVQITVNKATPIVSWSNPTAITYGTALSDTQLNASASFGGVNVPGTFVYTPAAGTVLHGGANQTLGTVFTPTNSTDYTTANGSTLITINKATPTLTWTNPAAITYGTTLSATQLNATASVGGTNILGNFVYTPAAGTQLHAGANQTLSVVFTPTSSTDYVTVNGSTQITVNKATPTLIWTNPAAMTYGTALSTTQLNATANVGGVNVSGTFVYTPAIGTVLGVGTNQTLNVAFTPTNTTDYTTANGSNQITVNKATPVVTWSAPAAITYGTALSATQLNATATYSGANVPGTFVYTPNLGTVLHAGVNQTISVGFTPTDTTNYAAVNVGTNITVNPAVLTITVDDKTRMYGSDNPTLTYNISGLVNGDTSGVLGGQPGVTTLATLDSIPNIYPIIATTGTLSSNDYSFNFVNGHMVVQATTNTTVSSSNDLTTFGQSVTFTATVTPTAGSGPTGTVQFKIDGNNVGNPVPLSSNNTASYTTSALAVGDRTVTAVYNGNALFTNSTSPVLAQTIALPLGGAIKKVSYTQTDGTKVSVTLTNLTAKLSFHGTNFTANTITGTTTVTGSVDNIDVAISDPVAGLSATSALTFTTTKPAMISGLLGNGVAKVGSITGQTTLGTLAAGNVDLIGTGINFTGDAGYIGTTTLRDLNNGAEITFAGAATKPLSMTFQNINDTSNINTNSAIGTFKANSVDTNTQITAYSIATLTTTVLTARSLRGDFGADVNLSGTGVAATKNTLGTTNIVGTLLGGTWIIDAGNVGAITVGDMSGNWIGNFSNSAVTSFSSKAGISGELTAHKLGSITAKTTIHDATIHSDGNIGAVTAAGMINSELYAGLAAMAGTLPTDVSDFTTDATITSLTIKGITGSPNADAFANSNVAAATLTMVSLKNARLDNGGTPFGIAAKTIKALSLTQGTKKYTWSSTSTAKWILNPVDMSVQEL